MSGGVGRKRVLCSKLVVEGGGKARGEGRSKGEGSVKPTLGEGLKNVCAVCPNLPPTINQKRPNQSTTESFRKWFRKVHFQPTSKCLSFDKVLDLCSDTLCTTGLLVYTVVHNKRSGYRTFTYRTMASIASTVARLAGKVVLVVLSVVCVVFGTWKLTTTLYFAHRWWL